jgi:uncharacterized protein (TIGR03083 family)
MGERPLRQFYGDDRLQIDVDAELLDGVDEPWRRHRERLLSELEDLDAGQWRHSTRCDAWCVQDVVGHLLTADAFWVVSLASVQKGEPSAVLADFDPSTTPGQVIEPLRQLSHAEVLERFAAGTRTFLEVVDSLRSDDWSAVGESPIGHVPARLVLAHAHWDSWLHERDMLLPLDVDPPVESDELEVATWYALAVGGVQGGLIGDPSPVGPGASEPIDRVLGFEELPDRVLRVRIDEAVRIELSEEDRPPRVSAVELVDGFAGRLGDGWDTSTLPTHLADHLDRARSIL